MNFDDFDDWEDAVVVGSFFNEMMEEESEEQWRKGKKRDIPSNPDDVDSQDLEDDPEDY